MVKKVTAPLPEFKRVRIKKTAEIVADGLRAAIIRGELRTGDLLPAEPQMIEKYGVSRPTLREAIRILESEGLLRITRGSRGGAVVLSPGYELVARAAGIALQSKNATIGDIYEMRTIIEPPAARMVAERNSKKAVPLLREHLKREFEVVGNPKLVQKEIANFHRLLVELAGLPPMTMVAHSLQGIVEKHMELRSSMVRIDAKASEERAKFGLRSHGKLINLIEEKKGAEAEAHWLDHMNVAGEFWLKDLGPKTVVELLGNTWSAFI